MKALAELCWSVSFEVDELQLKIDDEARNLKVHWSDEEFEELKSQYHGLSRYE